MSLPRAIRGVVVDIEGTTTPIAFVHEVLFPFARARLPAALERADDVPAIAEARTRLREEWAAEGGPGEFGTGARYALALMDEDRKSTGLKQIQGLIWQEGYADGSLRATVYPDVPVALDAWRAAGLRLAVFSSGSVLAQKLLFGHTEHGDLRDRFDAWFDTTTGPKREARAYRAIAAALELVPETLLFLSDVPEELDAARGADFATGLLRRPGNPPLPTEPGSHRLHGSFAELLPDGEAASDAKRKD